MKRILFIAVLMVFFSGFAASQPIDSLNRLSGISFPAYYSKGQEQSAATIATRIKNAMSYHAELLGLQPEIILMVLDTTDWKIYSSKGAVYGMPHYQNDKKALVVAAEDNPFWKSFLPAADKLPASLREAVVATYTNKEGNLSCQAFFDLLAIHELGHAFHHQGGLTMQRSWMAELFSNILLHTYIAEKEPGLLPALTLFPKMTVSGGSKGFRYTSLKDLQENYNEIAMKYPRNYGWYQCRWHMAAAEIYDHSGKKICVSLWKVFQQQKEEISDEALSELLENSGNKVIAGMIGNWDSHTIH
ncbi:MAG: hypothetical protein H7Y86_05720 [Rhizobacter sp.]|nr:hypothetical protein [Ferruginibacter sp.]